MNRNIIFIGVFIIIMITIFCGCNESDTEKVFQANINPLIYEKYIILVHYGGDSIEYDNIKVNLKINNTQFNYYSNDWIMLTGDGVNDTDGFFDVGERIYIKNNNIIEKSKIEISIFDLKTNKPIKKVEQ